MACKSAFEETGYLPGSSDNCAVAIRRLEHGQVVGIGKSRTLIIKFTVLEGHRFAVSRIPEGSPLLSWGQPFGIAVRDIEAGEYVCNRQVLDELETRQLNVSVPSDPNFVNHQKSFTLDRDHFKPGKQVPVSSVVESFSGYRRAGVRGVGTRNFIVLLGTSSRSSSFVEEVARRTRHLASSRRNVDGIVAVAHTEGGDTRAPNNREYVLRTLAGFMTHPNVGAVLAVDEGNEPLGNRDLEQFLLENGYPLSDVIHGFQSLDESIERCHERAGEQVASWIDLVDQSERMDVPASNLRVALQCGGSDSFSGISANPLVAAVAKLLLEQGGAVNLAETDELVGAEAYLLENVRDFATAEAFLRYGKEFAERMRWHGHSPEGNPSAGNRLRGLYNISLKSLGAAMKRHPLVRLDGVLDYGERIPGAGYFFMNSPGNDLESIAGQVASGCNLLFFTTGNGAVTNFPFVPTLKVMSTTRRFNMMPEEMDINAGLLLDGVPLEELATQSYRLALQTASSRPTKGEATGSAQVSIWRDWQQTDDSRLSLLLDENQPSGVPVPVRSPVGSGDVPLPRIQALDVRGSLRLDQVALIVPTSLCSSQIAARIARKLNGLLSEKMGLSRVVSLPHTEGCGCSSGQSEDLFTRIVKGHLTHPSVRFALLLEHGCEKVHNLLVRSLLIDSGLCPDDFGWLSIQLDGGIEAVEMKAEQWFSSCLEREAVSTSVETGLESFRLGMMSSGEVPEPAARSFFRICELLVNSGGTVVIPEKDPLLKASAFRQSLAAGVEFGPTLAFAESVTEPGFHVSQSPTSHWVELLTGLGASGVDIVVTFAGRRPGQGHPFIPVLSVSSVPDVVRRFSGDLDLVMGDSETEGLRKLEDLLARVASRLYTPRSLAAGNVAFQVTRGPLGVSV